MSTPIRLAAVQYWTGDSNRAANQDRALHLLDDGAHTADLVLMPMNSFANVTERSDVTQIAQPWAGPLSAIVAQIAVVRNCHICYSTIERDGDRLYNTSVLIGSNGVVLGRQRKTRLTEWERVAGLSPGDGLNVFPSNLGNIAILELEDMKDLASLRYLRGKNAQILLLPAEICASDPQNVVRTLPRWDKLVRLLAVRGRWCTVAANKIGSSDGRLFIGRSLVVDDSGEVVGVGSIDQEEVVRAEVTIPPRLALRAA